MKAGKSEEIKRPSREKFELYAFVIEFRWSLQFIGKVLVAEYCGFKLFLQDFECCSVHTKVSYLNNILSYYLLDINMKTCFIVYLS